MLLSPLIRLNTTEHGLISRKLARPTSGLLRVDTAELSSNVDDGRPLTCVSRHLQTGACNNQDLVTNFGTSISLYSSFSTRVAANTDGSMAMLEYGSWSMYMVYGAILQLILLNAFFARFCRSAKQFIRVCACTSAHTLPRSCTKPVGSFALCCLDGDRLR